MQKLTHNNINKLVQVERLQYWPYNNTKRVLQ